MKIKEICEKTKLTERAVRLYIENGLVAPSINESYSGRRNVEFSAEDVKRLKSISVLRKAGFSIAQIKLMQQEPEKSKEVLQEFIDKTNERIKTDSEIVACLMPLLSLEKLVPEQISQSLEKPVVEEKLLPAEDSELTPLQQFIRKLLFGVGVAGLIFAVICCALILRIEIRDWIHYLYPRYFLPGHALFLLWFFGALLLPLPVILLNRKKSLSTKKKQKIKTLVSLVFLCLYAWCTVFNYVNAFLSFWGSDPESYVISFTRNTENYMVFDAEGAEKALAEFLPEELPDVDGLKYIYRYKEYGVSHEPPTTRVYIEIPLDEDIFYETVEKYKAFRPSDSTCEPFEEKKDDWTVIYYREDYEHAPTNYNPVFAFNEKTKKVRLSCYYGQVSMKGARNGFDSSEW